VLAGREFFAGAGNVNLWSFTLALLLGTLSIISVGFVISSIIPTARFAQPLGSVLLYPMVALSGLFFPLDALPTGWRVFANMLPTTHAVALMQGVWDGAGWGAHWVNVLGLVAVFAVCSAVSTKTFRWE
jgi:ABC-2 type transport system permease protein